VYDKPGIVGGTSSWIQWLLPELARRGVTVRCLVLLHTGEKGIVSRALEDSGIECVFVHAHAYAEDRVRWILDDVRAHPCDVFVPNEVPAAYHAARWIRAAGIPTVGILHTDGDAAAATISLFVTGERSQALSAIVCVSKELERRVAAVNPAATAVHRIPYGADVPASSVALPAGTFRLVYAGRLAEEQKRIMQVVAAFQRVVREVPGTAAYIYGDGPQAADVKEATDVNGAAEVVLAGRLDAADIQRAMLECHAVVLLSDYEGLPVVLMEAMACGCVPVCLRIASGIPELVEDGVTGILVDDRGESFVSAVRRLRGDSALWSRMSLAARDRISREYSHESAADSWARLIRGLATGGSAKAPVSVPRKLVLPAPVPPLESARDREPKTSLMELLVAAGRRYLGVARRRLPAVRR
jgi:glycosyltransferase involved in cell wall biosynthesis